MNFSELNLRPELMKSLSTLNFETCTPIQAETIPLIMDGKDVSGLAQTGTGKTAAFLLPLMERILCARVKSDDPDLGVDTREMIQRRAFNEWRPRNCILVLVPTRELAEQVYQDVLKFRGDGNINVVSVYGGSSYEPQKEKIAAGVEFVVGTPGRLIDLYKSHVLDLKQVRAIVFDEADRMFDMGFKDDMKFILQRVPKDRQMCLFSATLNFDVLTTAYQFGADPVEVNVSKDQAKAENVKDQILHLGQDEKPQFLLTLLKRELPKQTIIFSNFKHHVEMIAHFLSDNGFPAMGISSLLTQNQRNRVIEQFKAENDRNILVATDVAARGLDIKGVDMVVNFELPDDAENYVHRIGRTGRAGETGKAFSLVSDRDVEALQRIEDYLKHKVDVGWIEETLLVKDFVPIKRESRAPRGGFQGPRGDASHGKPHRSAPGGRREGGFQKGPRGPRGKPAGEGRGEKRFGNRNDSRGETRGEPRGERPSEHRNENRGSHRAEGRVENRTTGRPDPKTASRAQEPQSQASKGEGTAHQHRDRRLGRHAPNSGTAAKNTSGPRKLDRPQGRHRPHSKPHGSASKASATSGKPNLAKKVGGFIKKLFGGKPTKT